ncbi:MAG: hypothetical protein AB7G93_01115 [Bdellovibrionales bacterium]
MLNADKAVRLSECPRCGAGGLERLKSHVYCVNCNYTDVPDSMEMLSLPDWVLSFMMDVEKKKTKQRKRQSDPILALAL